MPALVTVKVPPRSSSGVSVPARADSASRGDLGRERVERLGVARADDRDDEPLVGLDGDADVTPVQVDDLVAVEPRVQLGELPQRGRGRLERERQQQLDVDVGEVRFLDEGDGGDLPVRARQVLDDLPPHAAHGLAAPLRRLVFL